MIYLCKPELLPKYDYWVRGNNIISISVIFGNGNELPELFNVGELESVLRGNMLEMQNSRSYLFLHE